jgi:hypothetical protein
MPFGFPSEKAFSFAGIPSSELVRNKLRLRKGAFSCSALPIPQDPQPEGLRSEARASWASESE